MPSSGHSQISIIMFAIQTLRPTSIIDVGMGIGKYGFLCREYLDIWDDKLYPDQWTTRIDGIEIFPKYKNPIWDYYYDSVYLGDASTGLEKSGNAELILLIDIIEHMSKDDGASLLRKSLSCGTYVLVSTPSIFFEQEEFFGNAHETHVSHWTADDFASIGVPMAILPNKDHLICFLSNQGKPKWLVGQVNHLQYNWANLVKIDLIAGYRLLPPRIIGLARNLRKGLRKIARRAS